MDALKAGEGFGGAAGGDGGKALPVALVGAEEASAGGNRGLRRGVEAAEVAPEAGGVGLEGGAVVAGFVEEIPGQEEALVGEGSTAEFGAVALATEIGGDVDCAGK